MLHCHILPIISFFPSDTRCFQIDEEGCLDSAFLQAGDLYPKSRQEAVAVGAITGVKAFGWGTTEAFDSCVNG